MRESKMHEIFDCVPEIDYGSGYRYFLGNIQNYSQALLSILKSIKSKQSILNMMLQTGEYAGLRSITQTLQKMFGNIGAFGLAEASYQLERSLLNDEITAKPEIFTDYLESLNVFSDHLELLFKSLNLKKNDLEEEDSSYFKYDFTKTKDSIKRSSDLLERKIL
jgi:HPt (histidine-containing phosphotransfer) domain-containing protein